MGLFRRRKSRTDAGAVVSDRASSKADLAALQQFAESRTGVEAFIEPQTTVTQTTLLLVAGDGESMRRRVPSPEAGAEFVRKKLHIPVYDANRVGIPQRKRDYDLRQAGHAPTGAQRPRSKSSGSSSPGGAATKQQTPKELAAIMTLETVAAVDPLPDNPSFDELMRVYKLARKQAHPDRRGGDRTQWDTVEEAARALNLPD